MKRLYMATILLVLLSLSFAVFSPLPVAGEKYPQNTDSIHQGDLILSGNTNHTIIGETFTINGSIVITENVTLYLSEATLNFTQMGSYQHNITLRDPVGGQPRLRAYGSSIHSGELTMEILPYGNGSVRLDTVEGSYTSILTDDQTTLNISASLLQDVYSQDQTVTEISDSTIGTVGTADRSSVLVRDSTARMWVQPSDVNSTIEDLRSGFFEDWDFETDCAVAGDWHPDLTLMRTTVEGWTFRFYGASNTTLDHSSISAMHVNHESSLASFDSYVSSMSLGQTAEATLVNTTTSLYIRNEGKAWIHWYLDTHVIDQIDQDVPMAEVVVRFSNNTSAGSAQTDDSGWARLTLLEKMVNATSSYPEEPYTVTATYGAYINEEIVEMTENKELTISLPFMIPELPLTVFAIIATSFMVALALLLKRRLPS